MASEQVHSASRRRASGGATGARLLLATFVCALLVVVAPVRAGRGTSPTVRRAEHAQQKAEERLGHQCRHISSLKKLSEMQELIETLQVVIAKREVAAAAAAAMLPGVPASLGFASSFASSYSAPLRFFSQNPSAPCLAQADAIIDLGELIGERANVCSSEHLDKIEHYYERYLKTYYTSSSSSGSNGGGSASGEQKATIARSASMRVPGSGRSGSSSSTGGSVSAAKPVTAKFFALYSNQVSFVCKSNLLHSLRVVDEQRLATQADFDKAMPWLTEENVDTCKRVESLLEGEIVASQKLATSQDDSMLESMRSASGENLASAVKLAGLTRDDFRHCNARKLLSDLSNIEELVEVIESSESFVKFEEGRGETSSSSGLFLIVPESQKPVVGDMLATCAKLRPIYEQTVLPIVRLARLGFNPQHANFDRVCASEQLIKRWFGLTLVCNSMLNSRLPSDLNKYQGLIADNNMGSKSFVVVDEDDGTHEKSSTMMSAQQQQEQQQTDSQDAERLKKILANPIEDELWVYKYGTTKWQRIKDSVMRKVFKMFKVEDINSHIVFRKRVADTSRWIVRIMLITLALVSFERVIAV